MMGDTDELPEGNESYEDRLKRLADSGPLPEIHDEGVIPEGEVEVPIGESTEDEAETHGWFNQRG